MSNKLNKIKTTGMINNSQFLAINTTLPVDSFTELFSKINPVSREISDFWSIFEQVRYCL